MADEQGPTFDFGFDGDEADARTEAERMASVLEGVFTAAFAKMGPQLARSLSKGFKSGLGATKIFNEAQQATADFVTSSRKQTERMEKDFIALNARIGATRDLLTKAGVDPHLFAVFDQAINASLSNLREFDRELQSGTATPEKFKRLNQGAEASLRLAQKEVAGIQSELKTVGIIQGKAAEAQRAEQQQAATARLRASQQEHGKYIAAYQREGAETLAQTRIAGQRVIQNERQTQRVRVETMRFAFTQIRALERGVSSVLGGSARLASSAIGGVSAVTSRMAGLLRRNNRDLNDGLRPALLSREQSLSRSFSRQSTTVNNSLRQQSVALERFERQSSTGVVGALTGRSRVGTALGLGAGIGGGFALFQGLKNGLTVGGDFVQGLAVLEAQLELTQDQMQAVREQSIALGNDISLPGVSALDAAQAIQLLAKQFANLGAAALPAAQGAARGVLQLSRAAGVEAAEAARVVGAAVNVFGISADEAVAVADQITNALTKSAGVGFNEFADAFTQSAGVIKLFTGPGHEATETLAEFNAGLAVLAKNGLIGSDAGTSLKQFFLQANRGTADSRKQLRKIIAAAGETGDVFFDASGAARTFAESLDILRRGTKGLTNQELTTTLGKLFGSDAARAAAFLVQTTSEEFDGLTKSILKSGSAADIAAAQNVGLRGALDALGSVIETQQIKTYEKYQGVIGKVVLAFADLLNAFFEGRGIFGVIRGALAGIAVALGGLLVAKTAVEGVKLLTLALGGLVTPLGLIVGGLALLGGAIGALASASPEFRSELKGIGDALSDSLGSIAGDIGDGLGRLVGFLRTSVIPAVVEFAIALSRKVIPFVDSTVDHVVDLADAVVDHVLPAFAALRAGLSGEGLTGAGGLVGFGERVGGALRQAAIGVQAFAAALRGRDFTAAVSPFAFGGFDTERQTAFVKFFEALGASLRDTASKITTISQGIVSGVADAFREGLSPKAIVSSVGFASLGTIIGGPIGTALGLAVGLAVSTFNFSTLGRRLADAVGPQLQAFVGFIGDFLSGPGAAAASRVGGAVIGFLLGPFQQAVGQLGFLIGNLSTDPRFVHALEQLVGLALLTGVNFVKGLGRGIGDNLPALATLFGGQLKGLFKTAFEKAFDPRAIAGFLVSGLGAALIGAALIRSLSRPVDAAGQKVGQGFIRSFGSAVKSTATTAFSGTPFAQGFFGGFEKSAQKSAANATKAVETEFGRLNRNLNRLGQVGVLPTGFGKNLITDEDLRIARERAGQIEQTVGRVQTAGALARQQLGDVGRAVAGVFRGVGQAWSGDLNGATATIGASFGKLRSSLGDFVANMRQNLAAAGTSMGQVVGGALVAGIGSVLSGQQLGTADSAIGKGIGLAGIATSALFAGAAAAPLGLAIPAAAAVGSIGLITAAFSASAEAAKQSRARIAEWVETLKDIHGTEAITATIEKLTGSVGLLDIETQRLFRGFNFDKLARDALTGKATTESIFRDLASSARLPAEQIDAILEATDGFAGGVTHLKQLSGGDPFLAHQLAIADAQLRKNGSSLDDFFAGLEALTGPTGEIDSALEQMGIHASFILGRTGEQAAQAAIPTGNLVDLMNTLAENRPVGRTAADILGERSDIATNKLALLNAQEELIADARTAARAEVLATNIGLVGQAVETLNQQRVENINTQIGTVTTALQEARDAGKQALDNVIALLGGDIGDPFLNAFDSLIQALPGAQEELKNAIANSPDLDLFALTQQSSNLRTAFAPVLGPLQALISQAITDGTADTQPELEKFFADVIRPAIANFRIPVEVTDPDTGEVTVKQVALDPTVQDFIFAQLQGFLDNPALVAGLDQIAISNEVAADLQKQLDDLQLSLTVKIEFSPAQILTELKALKDAGLITGALPTIEEIIAAQQGARVTEAGTHVVDRGGDSPGTGVKIEQTNNIFEATPVQTASEVTANLRNAAASGRLGFAAKTGALG